MARAEIFLNITKGLAHVVSRFPTAADDKFGRGGARVVYKSDVGTVIKPPFGIGNGKGGVTITHTHTHTQTSVCTQIYIYTRTRTRTCSYNTTLLLVRVCVKRGHSFVFCPKNTTGVIVLKMHTGNAFLLFQSPPTGQRRRLPFPRRTSRLLATKLFLVDNELFFSSFVVCARKRRKTR